MRSVNYLERLLHAEAEGAGEGSGGGGSESPGAAIAEAHSGSGYSVTDPGYSDPTQPKGTGDDLADLKAENSKSENPSDDELDDADDSIVDESVAPKRQTGASAESDEDFSEALLDRAVALGYTVNDIKGFRSEKSLAKEIDRVEVLQQRMASRQAPAETEAEPEPQPNAIAEPDWEKMIEDGYDPSMVAMQQHGWNRAVAAEARAAQAEAGVQYLVQTQNQQAFEAQVQRFDTTIAGLGKEYESLFGKGAMREVKATNVELSLNRRRVFDKFQQLKTAYQSAKQALPPEKELIEEAVHAAFWKQTKSIARKELTNDIQKAGSQALSRPRSSGGKAIVGDSAALAKEADFWRKHS